MREVIGQRVKRIFSERLNRDRIYIHFEATWFEGMCCMEIKETQNGNIRHFEVIDSDGLTGEEANMLIREAVKFGGL